MRRVAHIEYKKLAVGGVQLFHNKFRNYLSTRYVSFYALHATLRNFTEEIRSVQITSWKSISAYIPMNCSVTNRQATGLFERTLRRLDMLQAFHDSNKTVIECNTSITSKGSYMTKSNSLKLIKHQALASNVANVAETEEVIGVRKGFSPVAVGNTWDITKQYFNSPRLIDIELEAVYL